LKKKKKKNSSLKEINKKIKELEYEDCKVLVSNVDSQVSNGDGIIIQVLGEMSNKGGASHKFAQTFFLAKQPNGYFVLNDIIRFLKEDIENEYEDFETPNENFATQEQYMDNQNNTMMTEEVIEQMNESLVIDNEATLEEKATLENTDTRPVMEEKKIETETQEEKNEVPVSTTTAELNSSATTNTPSAPANTNTASAPTQTTTTTTTPAPATELTESATENEPKRTNQVKSFATVTASNTTTTGTTTHLKEVSKVESKPLPNSSSQKNSQRGRQDQKGNMEREIFIKDVNDNISREKIKEAFSKFGEVKKVDVFYNRVSYFSIDVLYI